MDPSDGRISSPSILYMQPSLNIDSFLKDYVKKVEGSVFRGRSGVVMALYLIFGLLSKATGLFGHYFSSKFENVDILLTFFELGRRTVSLYILFIVLQSRFMMLSRLSKK